MNDVDPAGAAGGRLARPASAEPAVDTITLRAPALSGPSVPTAARALFGDRLNLAVAYADALACDGVARGMLGPREVPRLWERHLLNSAVLADLLPADARVVDVGTGAGLPGIPLAIRRPDLRVDLVEPMLRRTEFLREVVDRLGLTTLRVVRGRAEDADVRALVAPADWVVARAVAPLARLVEWCMPLLSPDGRLLALKGARAADEIAAAADTLRRCGAADAVLREIGAGLPLEPTWVVEVRRQSGRLVERGERPT